MELTCEQNTLFSALESVERIASVKSTVPIISNLLLEATKVGLRISANNLEMGMEVMVPARVQEEGAILVSAKTLTGIVSKLPEGSSVTVRSSENQQVRLSFKESKFQLYGLPPDEFPALPKLKDAKTIPILAEALEQMIRQTIFAVSTSEERYVLNGMLVNIGNNLIQMVATDGFRLAKKEVALKGHDSVEGSYIIPGRVLHELTRAIRGGARLGKGEKDEVKLSISPDQAAFRYRDYHLVSRLIQGQFPDYKQVIPKSSDTTVVLDTHELLEAVERAAIIAQAGSNMVKLELDGSRLHVSVSVPEVGSVDEVLSAQVKGSDKVQVAFSARLMMDVLRVIPTQEVILELGGSSAPGVFRPAEALDYVHLIMPIRTVETVPAV